MKDPRRLEDKSDARRIIISSPTNNRHHHIIQENRRNRVVHRHILIPQPIQSTGMDRHRALLPGHEEDFAPHESLGRGQQEQEHQRDAEQPCGPNHAEELPRGDLLRGSNCQTLDVRSGFLATRAPRCALLLCSGVFGTDVESASGTLVKKRK